MTPVIGGSSGTPSPAQAFRRTAGSREGYQCCQTHLAVPVSTTALGARDESRKMEAYIKRRYAIMVLRDTRNDKLIPAKRKMILERVETT